MTASATPRPKGIGTRHLDTLARVILTTPGKTAAQLAARAGLGVASTDRYLRQLERAGRVVPRIETLAEAEHRVDRTPRSVFTRRTVRRQLVWFAVDAVGVAA